MKFAGRGVAEQTVVVKQNMSEKEEKDERVEAVVIWLSDIEKYEEEIKKLSDSTISQHDKAVKMMEYEEEIWHKDTCIANYEDEIILYEETLGGRVGDEKARVYLEEVMEKVVMLIQTLSVILGWAGAGKTHTVALALKKPPPGVRVSTACAGAPIRATKHVHIRKGTEYFKEIAALEYLESMLKSGKEATSSKLVLGRKIKREDLAANSGAEISSVDKRLIGVLRLDLEEAMSLDGKIIAQLLDCGGQPQFLEILPRFIGGISLGILVIDLSKHLDERPLSYFYGEDGQPVGEGVKSSMTNEQLFRLFLQMIVSQSQEHRKTKFLIVGTHRDEEENSVGETREQKEKKIAEVITSSKMEDNVIYTNERHEHIIFAINAKNPEECDVSLGHKIMMEVMNEGRARHVGIPLKYLNLELTLKQFSTTEKPAFSLDEVFFLMTRYFEDHKSLKAGLQYLNQSFRIFYFSKLELVFGEPQLLLNFITKIIVRHIELTTNPKKSVASDGTWKCFKEQGIITEAIIKHFLQIGQTSLSVKLMVEVLQTLLIICEVHEKKYLMPCLLTTTTVSTPSTTPSMLLHFRQGLARFGIFCGTVCKLVSSCKWKLCLNMNNYRNSFHFTIPGCPGIVTLNDSFGSFFHVVLKIPPEFTHKSLYISDTLTTVINEVTEELRYFPDQPVLAFLCEYQHNPVLAPHAAEYLEKDYVLCTKDPMGTTKVAENNKIWLQGIDEGIFQTSSSMSCRSSRRTPSKKKDFQDSFTEISDPKDEKQEDMAFKYQQYIEKVPRNKRRRLQYEIELDQHIRRLAEKVIGWEEKYDTFCLDKYEVHDIKHGANKDRPALQRIDVLHTWKIKCSPEATYDRLLHVFVKEKFTDCAAEMVAILSEDWTYTT